MLSQSQCFLSTVCRSVNIGITFEIPKDLEEYFGLPLKIIELWVLHVTILKRLLMYVPTLPPFMEYY